MPSQQRRLLISGDVGDVFGTPPKPRANARILPGQPQVEWLVEKLTEPGETVLDPFMGSGTTGAACVRRGGVCWRRD